MQLLGWPFHSGWMLLTVISVCCCIDIGSPSEVSEEAVEGVRQPMSWNDFKHAGVLRKYHAIADVGGGGADDDSNGDALASGEQQDETVGEALESRHAKSQRNPFPRDVMMSDGPDDDYIYDVEGRPVAASLFPDVERYQFYYKPVNAKRSSSSSLKRQQASGLMAPMRRLRAQHQLEGRGSKDVPAGASPILGDTASSVGEPEPRALPLLGSHAAVAKLNRQKEAILKKILRQAARRQSMKRSPNCMRKCIAQGLLHPAQCHSLC